MRVLVTGGAGFLGSHLVDLLMAEEHEVTVLDDLSTGSASNLPEGVHLFQMDVRDALDDLLNTLHPEVIVHLAAQVSVPDSMRNPYRDQSINIGGTANLMSAAARAGTRKVVAISSAAVYGRPEHLPLTERSPTGALSPYGLSKLTAEQYIRMLGDYHGIAYTLIRPANIYGPRQAVDGEGAIVPTFLLRFLQGHDPMIHGDGSQTRDFVYVTDVASAIVQALTLGDGLTLNVSSGVRTSVMALWLMLATMTGWERPPAFTKPRPGDIADSLMDNRAARENLAWDPRVSLEEGLERTVAAFRESLVRGSVA